jgi:hypothetical protein
VLRAGILTALAAAVLAAPPALAQPITSFERLPRLFASAGSAGMAGPVTSQGEMLEGRSYIVRARGAYGAYQGSLMRIQGPAARGWHFCGQRVGARGQDAEFIWGLPQVDPLSCPNLPIRHRNLLLDSGAGFTWLPPVDTLPEPAFLARSNRYEYLVTRVNGNGPLSAGIRDSYLGDNRGALRLRVRALRTADCTSGRWERFNGAFSDEAECVATAP